VNASGLTVVLVEPEQAVNVGFVARTMACYGLSELRLVGDNGLLREEGAKKTAKGAGHILESASTYSNLSEAITDCHFSFGFTRRTREPSQKIGSVTDIVNDWNKTRTSAAKTALVFGRESQGLFRAETLVLSQLVRIDFPNETLSLNVSHAVAIALFAFTGSATGNLAGKEMPIHADQRVVLKNLMEALETKGFFRGGKETAQQDYVRVLWQRLQPTQRELEFLAGMLKRLSDKS
jgi:tRNA/rRNA methyltransferase